MNQNQFYFRRKNTMLIEQQLACDNGKAAKGPKWSLSQAATREAKYAKNYFQQNRYSIFEGHVMRKESISAKILRP